MSSVAPADLPIGKELADGEAVELAEREPGTKAARVKKRLTSRTATIASLVIAVVWTIPTFGLLVSSFRPAELIQNHGLVDDLPEPRFHARELSQPCSSRRRRHHRSSAPTS